MGTITARKRKDDSVAFMARVRVMRDGVTYHETETFDRRPAAMSWIKKRKRELDMPGAITAYKAGDPQPAKAIDRYTEESLNEIGLCCTNRVTTEVPLLPDRPILRRS